MNVAHLKYAVEVERTGSITRAAENLYMGQPNLSKAIRELETSMGFKLFKRSPAGVTPTARGAEFLAHARALLAGIEEMEALYGPNGSRKPLRLAAPEAGYVSRAFAEFVKAAGDAALGAAFAVKDPAAALSGIAEGEYDLAVIRFDVRYAEGYLRAIEEQGLKSELLWEYDCVALTRTAGAALETDIELCADEARGEATRHIFVRDRAALLDVLSQTPGTYVYSAPLPHETLVRYGLTATPRPGAPRMRELLVQGAGNSEAIEPLAARIRRARAEWEAALAD